MSTEQSATARVHQITASDLKARLASAEPLELVDVRTEQERAIAAIDTSALLDDVLHERLIALDRDTPLVFVCHHGMRSQAAAEYFLRLGFRNVSNVIGGIDAWSTEVDSSVPRY